MSEISKCKFCGGNGKVMYREAQFLGWRGGDGCKGKRFFAYVACNRCHARGPIVKTEVFVGVEQYCIGFEKKVKPYADKAIELWNRRADDGQRF